MFKTGNAVILRGSSSAIHSNKAIVSVIHRALKQTSLPSESVQLIEDTTRDSAKQLFTLNEYLDVLIPRGGKQLIDTVVREASVPVLETGAGNCHIFIDETADKQMAFNIIINAKTQRPSVCNAIETIVLHENWAEQYGSELFSSLNEREWSYVVIIKQWRLILLSYLRQKKTGKLSFISHTSSESGFHC